MKFLAQIKENEIALKYEIAQKFKQYTSFLTIFTMKGCINIYIFLVESFNFICFLIIFIIINIFRGNAPVIDTHVQVI